jgi:hypothetical protein
MQSEVEVDTRTASIIATTSLSLSTDSLHSLRARCVESTANGHCVIAATAGIASRITELFYIVVMFTLSARHRGSSS